MQTDSVVKKGLSKNTRMLLMVLTLLFSYAVMLIMAAVKIFSVTTVERILNTTVFLRCAGVMFAVFVVFIIYGYMSGWHVDMTLRKFVAMDAALLLGYVICLWVEVLDPYYMPVIFTAFLLVTIVDKRDALVSNIIVNLLVFVTVNFEHSINDSRYGLSDFTLILGYGLLSGSMLTYYLSGATTRIAFFLRSFLLSVINVEMLYIVSLIGQSFDFFPSFLIISVINFGQILIAIAIQPVFESLFGLLTNAKLREITDHSAPLLKRLIAEAPGTFNHCLSVASLAEVCAVAIGENALLTKACAYYHDIGKLTGPMYFAENQSFGENPHDNMLPEVSADILRKHTTYGYELCKKNKIPEEICQVCVQHHGTLPMIVFYNKAKQLTDSDVDIKDYCYDGITPVTKIAAIIMICDASEAAIRAMGKPDADQVDKLVTKIIRDRIDYHQFDECDITLKDLDVIKDTIKSAYGGLVHSRVRYPDGDSKK